MSKIYFKPLIFITFTLFLSLFLSCKTWSQKDWKNLKDRKFTFSKIEVFSKGINKRTSFNYMKKIPVFKILQLLSYKYNIEIDSSSYEHFLISGAYKEIKTSGILSDTDYVWQHPHELENEVIIEYKVDKNEISEGVTISYRIYLKTGKETRAYFIGGIAKIDEILPSAAEKLGYKQITEKGPNVYVYKDTGKELILTQKKLKQIKKVKKPEMNKSELLIINMIENYIKLLSPEEKRSFKEKLIDYLNNSNK